MSKASEQAREAYTHYLETKTTIAAEYAEEGLCRRIPALCDEVEAFESRVSELNTKCGQLEAVAEAALQHAWGCTSICKAATRKLVDLARKAGLLDESEEDAP